MIFAIVVVLNLIAAPAFIYKWRDAKGNLHITDRLENVPKELRAELEKQRAEIQKNTPPAPAKPVVKEAAPAPQTPASAAPSGPTPYERLKARMALEKDIKAKAAAAREVITKAREQQEALAEERGNLAANPVLNAAQPARVERMQEIEREIEGLERDVATSLGEMQKMIDGAKKGGYPESWVTGY